ncbi:tRNA (adenosine(37)-N6)-threonylcarbamoyltransferase complex dimerization subunit type 1 TsaB [Candidatus Falkowbacteria bacterium]|nr:tRNA (adenosine(37)-N6)-threonylcarbamoyltransferase complex dimerization subunit type 1 TsaB [Candidatus Falkowbacteria bacterium]
MKLFIDTSDDKQIFLALLSQDKIIAKKRFFAQYKQAEKLLPEIDKLLSGQAGKRASLRAIAVVSGPGPFTALRIGVTTANTLGWALKIPVLGLKKDQIKDLKKISSLINKNIGKVKAGEALVPFYGQEPNITVKNE